MRQVLLLYENIDLSLHCATIGEPSSKAECVESKSYFWFTTSILKMTGTIKKLTDKGFGFITAEGLAKDLFFHSKALVGVAFADLHEGDTVSFETAESPKGPNAINVQRA